MALVRKSSYECLRAQDNVGIDLWKMMAQNGQRLDGAKEGDAFGTLVHHNM